MILDELVLRVVLIGTAVAFLEENRILGMWNGVLDFSETGTCHMHIYTVLTTST